MSRTIQLLPVLAVATLLAACGSGHLVTQPIPVKTTNCANSPNAIIAPAALSSGVSLRQKSAVAKD